MAQAKRMFLAGGSPVSLKYNINTKKIYVANINTASISIIGMDSPYQVKNINSRKITIQITIDNSDK